MKTYQLKGIPFTTAITLLVMVAFLIRTAQASTTVVPGIELTVRPENRTLLVPGTGYGDIQIRIVAPVAELLADRPLLNLALVIDKSGSMNDEGKMRYARQAAHQLVDRLTGEDILSIITYDHTVRVVWPARYVRDRQRLHDIVDGIYAGGRTFLSGGLERGFKEARVGRRKGYVNRVLLLSDGLANVGVVSRNELRKRASRMADGDVSISTFGVGDEFDEDVLAAVARGGGGSYYYIAHPSDMAAALDREFQMASTVVGMDVEINIELHGNSRFHSATGYSWKKEGGSVVIGLGDLSAGESRTLMARLNVSAEEPGDLKVANVTLSCVDPKSGNRLVGEPNPVSWEVVRDIAIYESSFDDRVRENRAVLESSADLDEAARMVDKGDRRGALSILGKAVKALMGGPSGPAVEAQIRKNQEYQEQIRSMDGMQESEIRKMQKDIKFRSYQNLYQQ